MTRLWRRAGTGPSSSRTRRTWSKMSPTCTWCPEAMRCRTGAGARYRRPGCGGSGSGGDGASAGTWVMWARGTPCHTECGRGRWTAPTGTRRSRPWSFCRTDRWPVCSSGSLGLDSLSWTSPVERTNITFSMETVVRETMPTLSGRSTHQPPMRMHGVKVYLGDYLKTYSSCTALPTITTLCAAHPHQTFKLSIKRNISNYHSFVLISK